MKKILHSAYAKAVFVLLFLASLTLGSIAGIHTGVLMLEEGDLLCDIGRPVEGNSHFHELLRIPEEALMQAYWDYAIGISGVPELKLPDFYAAIRQNLKQNAYIGRIEYYVRLDDMVFANAGAPQDLREGYYKFFAINDRGRREFYKGGGNYVSPELNDNLIRKLPQEELVIAVRVAPYYAAEYTRLLEKQENILLRSWVKVAACALGLILSLIYLICLCGKDKHGQQKELWTDRLWAEVHLLLAGAVAFGAFYLTVLTVNAAFSAELPMDEAYLICGILLPTAGGVVLSCVLSLIRNVKAGVFVKRCGILLGLSKLISWLWMLCKFLWKWLCWFIQMVRQLRGRTFVVVQTIMLFILARCYNDLAVYAAEGDDGSVAIQFLWLATTTVILILRERDLERIQKGAAQIRNGDLSHRIAEPFVARMKPLVKDINQIAEGLDASLAAKVKAEQMKTELITNVSHDLKTPLTSIISYTELLSRVEGLSEEAQDYIRVIGDKSQRLRVLTQDLFDISKVQSGNEEVQWELLDAALLLEQSLAEEKNTETLQFCVKTEENLNFMGDGRKLSRVLANLIQNATKYALQGTRVFLSAYRADNRVVMECKNTSAYPLDFSAEEILGRFVRGDSSRSTDGNGLGLPIAKSYTELCGGDFQLILDGDLFKVRLSFPCT